MLFLKISVVKHYFWVIHETLLISFGDYCISLLIRISRDCAYHFRGMSCPYQFDRQVLLGYTYSSRIHNGAAPMLSLSYLIHDGFLKLATALRYSFAILPGLALALKSPPPRRRRGAPDRVSDLFEALDAFPFFVVMEDSDYTIRFMNGKLREKFGNRTGEKCYRAFIGRESPCPVCPVRAILHEGKDCFTCGCSTINCCW